MNYSLVREGEVVLNKLNGQKYIVTHVDRESGMSSAALLEPEKAPEGTPLTVTITKGNERLYRHKYNTIKSASFESYEVSYNTFMVDGKDIPTGDIKPLDLLGTTNNNIVFHAQRGETKSVYAYNVKNDRFGVLFDIPTGGSSVAAISVDKDVLVVTNLMFKPLVDDETEEQIGTICYKEMTVITESRDGELKTTRVSMVHPEGPVIQPKVTKTNGYDVISMSSLQSSCFVILKDNKVVSSQSAGGLVPQYVGEYEGQMYFIGHKKFATLRDGVIDKVYQVADLWDPSDFEVCTNILFEVSTVDNVTSYVFTDSKMHTVRSIDIIRTDDRGDVVKVS